MKQLEKLSTPSSNPYYEPARGYRLEVQIADFLINHEQLNKQHGMTAKQQSPPICKLFHMWLGAQKTPWTCFKLFLLLIRMFTFDLSK